MRHFCAQIHNTLAKTLKYAQVWGTSAKYMGQRVGLKHALEDEDVVQIVKDETKLDPDALKEGSARPRKTTRTESRTG